MEDKKDDKKTEIEEKIKELEKKTQEYLDGWKRERAGFMNYKKEEMERIDGLIKYSNEEMILKILPILDNFDIAEKHLAQEEKNNCHIKGLLLIKEQLKDFLKSQGVEEIKAVGKFNPNFMEAVEEVGENQELGIKNQESGVVIEEIQKGYKINNRLLRPARVKVAK